MPRTETDIGLDVLEAAVGNVSEGRLEDVVVCSAESGVRRAPGVRSGGIRDRVVDELER